MHVEVKVTLQSANDYYTVMSALENRHIGEETYRDCFFDFRNGTLAELNSVLRLRTPCLKAGEEASPLLASAAGGACHVVPGVSAVAPSGSFEEFLQSGCGPDALNEEARLDTAQSAYLSTGGASADSGTAQTALLAATFAGAHDVVLLPGQSGKLVLKQRNTVERGQQMSFVMEDNAVPADVVVAMVGGGENPFDVLCRYAESSPSSSQAREIVHQLRAVTQQRRDQETSEHGPIASGARHSSTQSGLRDGYEYVRYAAASATPPRSQESREREIDSLTCALVCTGSYVTTRSTFRYLCSGAAQLQHGMSPDERAMWEDLRLRLDATVYPFGEQFEVEIPKIPAAFLDDVTREVFSFLRYLNVRFHPASQGKYARFIQGVRSLHARREGTQDIKIRLSSVNGYDEVKRNLESIAQPALAAAPSPSTSGSDVTSSLTATLAMVTQTSLTNDQRRVTNLDVDQTYRERSASAADTVEEEKQVNYFFDGPNQELRAQHCFLRLRCVNNGSKYVLVLKENQSFTGGQQDTLTQKTPLSSDVATVLITDPCEFLQQHHENNAIASTLWHRFELRQLSGVAYFTTMRLKVPWRAAHSQRYVPERSSTQMLSAAPPTVQLSAGPDASLTSAAAEAVVPPLIIHLDRTQFELPHAAVGVPGFTQHVQADFATGRRTYEMYEVEVTNLAPSTAPSQVLQELTDVLDWLGVEWQYGTQSKLDQFYALLDSSAAQANARNMSAAAMLFDRWGMQGRQ